MPKTMIETNQQFDARRVEPEKRKNPPDNVVTKGVHDGKTGDNIGTNEEQISCTDEELEKRVSAKMEEFDKQMELGRNMNIIMNESGFNDNGLDNDMMVALKTYELHGKNMDMKDVEWRGWQMDLRQNLDKPCDIKVIWIVGKDGNEGKSFFQANIRDEFGYSRVCKLTLSENSRNSFHIMGKTCSNKTDIFLFNVGRGVILDTEQYEILESIKDGEAADGKYMSRQLNFSQPNVLMVFSNREPEKYKLSMDRWVILKISKDLTQLTDIHGGGNLSKKKGKRLDSGCDELSDEESDSQSLWDL